MMRWIEANSKVFRYQLTGSGARVIVLIHEAGGSLQSWDELMPLLPAACRILRYDQLGFGMSERSKTISIASMAQDLLDLLDALGLVAPCHLVGTAIGATLALSLAASDPGRVASVLATSPVTGGIPEAAKSLLEQRALLLEEKGMRAVADSSLLRSYPPALRQDADRFDQYRARFIANDPLAFAALTRVFTTLDLGGCYEKIACPVLIVGCSADQIKPPHECAAAADLIADGRYALAESGHFISLQAPQLLANLLDSFMETLDGRP
jgi:3-oxoadipate enol-lactonase